MIYVIYVYVFKCIILSYYFHVYVFLNIYFYLFVFLVFLIIFLNVVLKTYNTCDSSINLNHSFTNLTQSSITHLFFSHSSQSSSLIHSFYLSKYLLLWVLIYTSITLLLTPITKTRSTNYFHTQPYLPFHLLPIDLPTYALLKQLSTTNYKLTYSSTYSLLKLLTHQPIPTHHTTHLTLYSNRSLFTHPPTHTL